MTSTNTHGAGLGRLLTSAAVLALLLFTAGAADAQTRIFVDSDNGVDTNTGETNGIGSNGPVRSLDRAFQIARQSNNSNIISIEAGAYDLNEDIGDDSNEFNLAFEARPDPNGTNVVVLDLNGGDFVINPGRATTTRAARSFDFLGAGGTFRIEDGTIDFESGTVAIGTGLVELDVDFVEVTSAAVTGTPDYDGTPDSFRFDGTFAGGNNPSGNILPAVIDANGNAITIDIDIPTAPREVSTVSNVSTQLEDDGDDVDVFVASNNAIVGSIAVRDGNGTAGNGDVNFNGGGNFGDVSVGSSAVLNVNGNGTTVGDFTQTGGEVNAPFNRAVFIVEGDFNRSGGDFDGDFVLQLDGDGAQTFATGPQFDIKALRFTGGDVSLQAGGSFDITGEGSGLNDPDFLVGNGVTFDANGGTVTLTEAGIATIDGDFEDGTLRFAGDPLNNDNDPNTFALENPATLNGDGMLDDVRVDRNVNIAPTADLEFEGTLFLINGSMVADDAQVVNNGVVIGEITGDISPVGGSAMVVVDITNENGTPRIIEDDTDGDNVRDSGFNDENNLFDLTYLDDRPDTFSSGTVGAEYNASNIRNLTIDVQNGQVVIGASSSFPRGTAALRGTNVPENAFIQGDLLVRDGFRRSGDEPGASSLLLFNTILGVVGDITVEDDSEVFMLSFGAAAALIAAGPNTTVAGAINGFGFYLPQTGNTTRGAGDVAGTESEISATIGLLSFFSNVDNVETTITNFVSIDGDITDDFDEDVPNQLTINLLGDRQGSGGSPERAGNLNGEITLLTTELVLESGVHVTNPTAVVVETLNVGDNTFFLEGPTDLVLGSDVIGLGSVWPATGFGVVDDANGDGVVDINDGDLVAPFGSVDGADAAEARRILDDLNQNGVTGDLNGDNDVNAEDQAIYNLVASVVDDGATGPQGDIVNDADIRFISNAAQNGVVIADGDLDGDNDVDNLDQAIYDVADVNNDGIVSGADQNRVAAADPDGNGDIDTGGPALDGTAGDVNPADGFNDSDIDRDGDVDDTDQAIFNNFDLDNDGDADADDRAAFQAADGNGDGIVSATGDVNGDGAVNGLDQVVFDAADANDDDEVDAQDLLIFAAADQNGDGVLDTLEADVNGDGAFDDADRLILNRALQGATESNLLVVRTFDGVDGVTIPTFHPGDDATDITRIADDILVTNLLRITGILDAETFDNRANQSGPDVDNAVTLADGATLVLDDGYTVLRQDNINGNGDGNDGDDELLFAGGFDVVDNEQGPVDPFTTFQVLAPGNVNSFTVNGTSSLPEVVGGNGLPQVTFDVVDFVVSSGAQFNLNGHVFQVSGDLTLNGDDDVVNTQPNLERAVADENGVAALRVGAEPFSEIAFVGADSSMINLPSGATMLGDGVDIRINKDAGAVVALMSGALLFDDEFDGTPSNTSDDSNDETLFLESGIFVVGDRTNQQTVYVRLDHENTPLVSEDVDGGQGFVIVGAEGQDQSVALTDSYVAGNVRKRVANVGTSTPGRVIYPTGEMDDSDEDDRDYAPFTFDFESNGAGATFGLRSINVTFVDENPGNNASLPLATDTAIEATSEFYWLVSTTGSALGQGTTFNVEARADDFLIVNNIDNLELIRRQDGSVANNAYTGVGGDATAFTIDPDGTEDGDLSDDIVIVQESGLASFLGPQGTVVTFGLTANQRPVNNEGPSVLPTEFALNGTFPNPFSARAELSFDLPEAATVTLEVFDVMGRQVLNVNTGGLNAGADQRIAIDGSSLASGVYVYRLRAAGASDTWTRSGQITLAR